MDWYLKFKLLFLLNIYACKIKVEKKCDTTNNLEEKIKLIVELYKNILMNMNELRYRMNRIKLKYISISICALGEKNEAFMYIICTLIRVKFVKNNIHVIIMLYTNGKILIEYRYNRYIKTYGVSSAAEYDQNGICHQHDLHFLNTIGATGLTTGIVQ